MRRWVAGARGSLRQSVQMMWRSVWVGGWVLVMRVA